MLRQRTLSWRAKKLALGPTKRIVKAVAFCIEYALFEKHSSVGFVDTIEGPKMEARKNVLQTLWN